MRVNLPCDEAKVTDPCFATMACLCSNNYFSVAETMPRPPAQYSGLGEVLKLYTTEKQLARQSIRIDGIKENRSGKTRIDSNTVFDSIETWHYIVAGSAAVMLTFLIC